MHLPRWKLSRCLGARLGRHHSQGAARLVLGGGGPDPRIAAGLLFGRGARRRRHGQEPLLRRGALTSAMPLLRLADATPAA